MAVDSTGKLITSAEAPSAYAEPYVSTMLGKSAALADQPYNAYTGPLTAGPSDLQTQSFQGLAGLVAPDDMGAYNPRSFTDEGMSQQYMNPYLQASLEPQIAEARRQADITRNANAGRLTRAGAFGGGRQAIMESEGQRNMLRNVSDITGAGYKDAYDRAQTLFGLDEDRRRTGQLDANKFGFDVLDKQGIAGGTQRGIEQQGIDADIRQFETERDYPYEQLKFMQSILSGIPMKSESNQYQAPSSLSDFFGASGGTLSLLEKLFRDK